MPSLRKKKVASHPPVADERLQESLDALGEGFALFDSGHTLVRCNKQFAALSGYPARLCRPGATLDALLRFAAERGDFGAGDRSALVTERLKHIAAGDGTIEACDVTRAVVVLRHRRLAEGYVLLTCTDQRDVHAAKEAMRATEERFALVTAAATEGYYDWNVVNDQLYVSPQLNRMFGFEAGHLKSRMWNDRVVDDDSEIYRTALLDHFKQRTARLQCEYRIRLASGEVRWVADRATAVHGIDGRAIRLVGAISDITAEKALAAALKGSEARYSHALDAIGEGLYEWDIDNNKMFYSPGVYRELDIPEGELQTPQDWIERIHPDDLSRFQAETREHLRGHTPRFTSEVRYRASDGSWRWALQHGLVVRDADGRAIRLIGSTGDITQSKQLAEALVQAEARLQAAVEAASEGFVVWDENDRLVTCNSVYRNFFRGAEHLVSPGNAFETIIRAGYDRGMFSDAGSDFDAWFARLQASRHNHSGHREQHVFDGQWLLVSDRALSSGGVVSVYADITENKRRELELADAVTRLGSSRDDLTRARTQLVEAIEAISEGFVLFDANDRLILHNSRFLEFYAPVAHVIREGVSFREMLTETVRSGLTAVDRPPEEWLEWRLSLHRNQTAPLELRLSGGRWLSVNERRTLEGGVVGIYADITSLKEREKELAQTATSLAVARDDAEAALERQMATADILKVIASSPTDVQPVLDAVVKAALRFCGAPDAVIALRDDDIMHYAKHSGTLGSPVDDHNPLDRTRTAGRAILEGRTIHIADITGAAGEEFTKSREDAPKYGFKALVSAPMMREGVAIGCILLRKPDAGAFTPRQIELLETFAAQAVIAIENVRLFTELRDSLERLKAAQANLIQSEKMASLGQLTAGIAHEIKNPLNFVNNFASLSVELLDELKEVAGPALDTLDDDKRAELDETMGLLVGNLVKITEHGKRADGIVRSMLSHSRGGAGDWQPSDINALVEEALNLAYHGARAQDKEFNVTLERDLEKTGQPIDVVPQDVTRVFLNLFGNGFYAASKRRLNGNEAGFRPTIRVTTRETGDGIEVRVRDNGAGIPPDVREKLFQPFFTTKPTGEGTGLGLSISYDIVTQQHGGTIAVESVPGEFTEFTVRLPRARRVVRAETVR